MPTTRLLLACALLATGPAACAAPGAEGRPRDTLFVAAPAPLPAVVAPAPATPDTSTTYTLRAFSGMTASSGDSPPELAIAAADGRQVGYEPATRRYLHEIPGADYDSSATVGDDDVPPGGTPSLQAIDSREIEVPAHAGESFTLVITAAMTGAYVLHVTLDPEAGTGAGRHAIDDLPLRAGEPRRFTIRVGRGTLQVTP